MFTTEALQFIKSRLPKGAKHKIQKSTGYTISYINMVLNGERSNHLIVDNAVSIIEEASEGNQTIYDRLNKVANLLKQPA